MVRLTEQEKAKFVFAAGQLNPELPDRLMRCNFSRQGNLFLIEVPNSKMAQFLWHQVSNIAVALSIEARISAEVRIVYAPNIIYDFNSFEMISRGAFMFTQLQNPNVPTQEKDLWVEAMTSPDNAAVVRMRDNVVIQTNLNQGKYSPTVPLAKWVYYDITPLWRLQEEELPEQQLKYLIQLYHHLGCEFGKTPHLESEKITHIGQFEYESYCGVFSPNGEIIPGEKKRFCSEAYLLPTLFGEPCRLTFCRAA